MIATIVWIALLAAAVGIELCSRRAEHRVASLAQVGAWVARHVLGRALLWLCWLFVGLHLFARYGARH